MRGAPNVSEFRAAGDLGAGKILWKSTLGILGAIPAKIGGAQWLADWTVFAMMRAATGCLAPGCAPMGHTCGRAPVAELVDAPDSKSGGFTSVLVRVRPGAPFQLLCKIPIATPTQRIPQKIESAPQPIDGAKTASAAMRSRGVLTRGDLQRLGHFRWHSKSSAQFLNCLHRILFQNRCIAGCVLLQRPCRVG